MRSRTHAGPDTRQAVFSRTKTFGGFSPSSERAESRRVREATRSGWVTARLSPENLMQGKPQKAKS